MTIRSGMLTFGLLVFFYCIESCGTVQQFRNMAGSNFDTTRDAQGRSILADTPRMWDQFKLLTDLAVESERSGNGGFGGRSPNEGWLMSIRHLQTDHQHPEKYINYIIEKRRAAGLPDLVGYP